MHGDGVLMGLDEGDGREGRGEGEEEDQHKGDDN